MRVMSKPLCTSSLLAGSLLAATLLAALPASAAGPGPGTLICENGVCWLDPAGIDSDGDGYSDADERAAGTDPKDASSHPKILQLLDGYLAGLRPEGPGFRELVVLPELAPDGSALGSSALTFGPQRSDALTRLGVTDGRLGGIDVSNGLRASIGMAGAKSPAGSPRVSIGRIDPLVAGGKITGETTSILGSLLTDYTQNGKDVGYKLERPDGSMKVEINAEGKQQHASLNPPSDLLGGGTEQVGSSSTILTGEDGSTTSHNVTQKVTKDGEGGTVTERSSLDETRDSKGNLTSRTHTKSTETERSDGSRTVEKATTTLDPKTGNTTTTSSVTETKPNGQSTCTGDGCPKKEYVNTEIDPGLMPGDTIVITPAVAARLAALAGGDTNQGDTGVEPGSPDDVEPPQYSPKNRGVILVDPSNDAVWWTPMPTMPDLDKGGGNTTFVRHVTGPLGACVPTQTLPCPT